MTHTAIMIPFSPKKLSRLHISKLNECLQRQAVKFLLKKKARTAFFRPIHKIAIACLLSFSLHSVAHSKAEEPSILMSLFVAKKFVSSVDYERYVLEANGLWMECGTISDSPTQRQKRKLDIGDSIFRSDPNLIAIQRSVKPLLPEELDKLQALAGSSVNVTSTLPKPGSLSSLNDSGILELSIESESSEPVSLQTSVDALYSSQKSVKSIKTLFTHMREISQWPCGHKHFGGN